VIAFDCEGEHAAYGWHEDGAVCVEVPDVATFSLPHGSNALTGTPATGADRDAVVDAYLGTALPFVLQATRGLEVLHASAVIVRPHGCVAAFCGRTETGKTTVAYGLAARGHGHWADDSVAFEVGDDLRLRAIGLPFMVNLRDTSSAYFDSAGLHPERSAMGGRSESFEGSAAQLESVFVLDPVDDDSVEAAQLERLEPGVALRTLLPNAYRFRPETRERGRQTMAAYLELVALIPVWAVRYRRDIDGLPELLDVLERTIAAA
jgi:hypothetical protein